jgi:hypothetical protein
MRIDVILLAANGSGSGKAMGIGTMHPDSKVAQIARGMGADLRKRLARS